VPKLDHKDLFWSTSELRTIRLFEDMNLVTINLIKN